jgi:hypothetical protein
VRARLRLELTDAVGAVLATRRARNAVMRDGSLLVAQLFAGAGAATRITHMGVGTSDVPEADTFTTTALANADPPLAGDIETAIAPEAFAITTDTDRRVTLVRVRATLGQAAAIGTIREAGLLSRTEGGGGVLYNRVTFAPVDKGDDHEMTLFWEIEFPYGDLHGLA